MPVSGCGAGNGKCFNPFFWEMIWRQTNRRFLLSRGAPARRRRLAKMKKTLQDDIDAVSSDYNVEKNKTGKRWKRYKPKRDSQTEETIKNPPLNDPIEPTRSPSTPHRSTTNLDDLIVDSLGQSFFEANKSIQLSQQQADVHDPMLDSGQQPNSLTSSVTGTSMKKSVSFVDINREDSSQQCVTLQYVPKGTPTLSREKSTPLQYVPKATLASSSEHLPSLHYVPKASPALLHGKLPSLRYVPKTSSPMSPEKLPPLHYVSKSSIASSPGKMPSLHYVPKTTPSSSSENLPTLEYVPNPTSMPSPSTHSVRVSRNKKTIAPKPLTTILSESIDPNAGNHVQSANGISNPTTSMHSPQSISAKSHSTSIKPTYYTPPTNPKKDHSGERQRAASFNHTNVSKVTPVNNDMRSAISHTSVSVYHDNDNKQLTSPDGVTVTPLRKTHH